MSDRIELRDLRVSAVVGVLPEERDRAQPLSVDLDLYRPLEAAALNDDLTETTNYAEVLNAVVRVAEEGRFNLLETLAYRIAHEALAVDDQVERVTVVVRKLRPPVEQDVATVGVRCEVERPG